MACFIEDNCLVNTFLSYITSIPLICCYSRKFNLAVEKWIESQDCLEEAISTVGKLMVQLKYLKHRARIRELTHLGAILPNVTRWSGKFDMIRRYFKIKNGVKSIKELDKYLPSHQAVRIFTGSLKRLFKFREHYKISSEESTYIRRSEIYI